MTVKEITTGQDSFLDIVANLVGVLIILVVVVGVQAKVAMKPTEMSEDVAEDMTEQISGLELRLTTAVEHAKKMELDNGRLNRQIQQEAAINLGLGEIRHQMLVQIQVVEKQLESRRAERRQRLNERQAMAAERADEAADEQRRLEVRLAEVIAETRAVSTAASQPKSEVIEHFPNPIAKTVFSEEVHFQLKRGKIAYVPLEPLLTRMKSQWKTAAQELQTSRRIVEMVGPIDNFRLQYELELETVRQVDYRGGQGGRSRQAIRFGGFSLFPSSEELGDTVESSIENGSQLRDVLRRYPPGKTTVSLWIYPDSYSEYNVLKKWLYDHGYQIACWPLDAGKRISGGPKGLRSSAQ